MCCNIDGSQSQPPSLRPQSDKHEDPLGAMRHLLEHQMFCNSCHSHVRFSLGAYTCRHAILACHDCSGTDSSTLCCLCDHEDHPQPLVKLRSVQAFAQRIEDAFVDVASEADSLLSCAVCFELKEFAALCPEGHSVCEDCRECLESEECPHCRAEYPDQGHVFDYIAYKIIRALK